VSISADNNFHMLKRKVCKEISVIGKLHDSNSIYDIS
jgi:hypothetical protein